MWSHRTRPTPRRSLCSTPIPTSRAVLRCVLLKAEGYGCWGHSFHSHLVCVTPSVPLLPFAFCGGWLPQIAGDLTAESTEEQAKAGLNMLTPDEMAQFTVSASEAGMRPCNTSYCDLMRPCVSMHAGNERGVPVSLRVALYPGGPQRHQAHHPGVLQSARARGRWRRARRVPATGRQDRLDAAPRARRPRTQRLPHLPRSRHSPRLPRLW